MVEENKLMLCLKTEYAAQKTTCSDFVVSLDIRFTFIIMSLFFVAQSVTAQGRRMEGDLDVTPVRGSVYMMVMEPAGNVGVSVGPDGAFIIDDQFAPMTDRIVAAVSELTEQSIKYVLNTHWHGDHTGSNENFGNRGHVIVAHDNARTRMMTDQYHLVFRAETPPHPEAALPVITFSDTMTFQFNDDVIYVIHVPAAHTDGDAIFYFEKADVMHTGDAFINRGFPLIDIASGGTIKGQIEATNKMLELVGSDTIIIPGHGPLADRERMIEIRDMLVQARNAVVKYLEQDMSLDEILAERPLAGLEAEWGQGIVKGRLFVRIIYQSETGDWQVP
jgi:glyoxylase-like metal-dependent hydrolase (beta-lactamase superfamily II)